MNGIRLLLVICLIGVYSFAAQSQTTQPPLLLKVELNGVTVNPAYLRSQVFCLSSNDTLRIEFTGTDSMPDIQYAVSRIELWGQVNMGAPVLLGQLAGKQAATNPVYEFILRDFNPESQMPNDAKTVRVSVRVGPVLKVSGSRLLEMIDMNETQDTFSFMLVKKC